MSGQIFVKCRILSPSKSITYMFKVLPVCAQEPPGPEWRTGEGDQVSNWEIIGWSAVAIATMAAFNCCYALD